MAFKQNIDLYWTQEGDFVFDTETEDLLDTTNEHYRGFVQQILTRLMSSKGEWSLQRQIGANIVDFLGQPNSRETGSRIQERVIVELTRDGLVPANTLKVDVVPTSRSSVEIFVFVVPPGSRQAVQLRFGYDLTENRLVARNG